MERVVFFFMNLSQLITRLKIDCGIYSIALPFENPDQAIIETIQNITLRTFSTYCPYYEKFRFDLNSLEQVEKGSNYTTHLLPDVFSQREILFIRDITYEESSLSGLGYWGGGVPLLNGSSIRQNMLSNASLPIVNRMVPKITYRYEHPRKVTIYNAITSSKLVFEIALMHDKNLASITPTSEESFYELAVLDIKNMLYQTLKHYSEIQSAYGNINLKLDDWQQASSDRKQLLENWDNLYHMDITPFTYG